jgi:hypothetical protein
MLSPRMLAKVVRGGGNGVAMEDAPTIGSA